SVGGVAVVKKASALQRNAQAAEIAFAGRGVVGAAGMVLVMEELLKKFREFFYQGRVSFQISAGGAVDHCLRAGGDLLRVDDDKSAVGSPASQWKHAGAANFFHAGQRTQVVK